MNIAEILKNTPNESMGIGSSTYLVKIEWLKTTENVATNR